LRGYPLSHTWPVRGGDQLRTTPMPFQRISTDLCGSPDHPRRAETAERATWGTKTPPRPPTAGTPPAPARVRRKPRRWDPLVPIWGGSPAAAPRPPAPSEPRALLCRNSQGPSFPQRQGPTAPHAIARLPPACRVTRKKTHASPDSRFVQILLASLDSSPPLWSPLVAWCPNLGSHTCLV
jgi:hypothetical protein